MFTPRDPGRSARILIADDDREIRDVLREFLRGHYECETARSAEEALDLIAARDFQLVLSDIEMGGMSGLELASRAREIAPETVMIVISGTQTVEGAVGALRAGAFDFVTKPFDLEQVEMAVCRALEHQELIASKRGYESRLQELISERTAELDRALDSLEGAYRMTLKALVSALEARDHETHGHSERVVTLSLRLGREMRLDPEQMRSLEFGSLLHDIGKIGVPDSILRKPSPLTPQEWEKMRQHPALGERILSGIEFLRGAARVVAEHHEKWDGTGYPLGLSGEQTDISTRVFAVADAFDAMTSDRVYRRGMSYDLAAAELTRCSGSQFDPAVVSAFLSVPRSEWEGLRQHPAGLRHATTPDQPDPLCHLILQVTH